MREVYGPDLPIVFLSGARVESYDRTGGILLGVDDYVVKPFDVDELPRARPASRRARGPARAQSQHDLTRREREILSLLARGIGQTDIAKRLVISEKTVATHIQRVMAKLGVRSRAQAVALAHREHLVDRDDVFGHAA